MAGERDIAETLRVLERLIAFDTTSHLSNLALIAWIEDYLRARGVDSERVTSPDGAKANLIAIVGPRVAGGVVLSGHTDVVPVTGQAWRGDPWTLSEREGRYYGRGASDMKSFLALALAHVDAALASDLKAPIILAFSHDEEVGCVGAPALIARLLADAPKPSAVIVGEPTSMKVVSAHKGIRTFRIEVEGLEAHSSQIEQGVSAIMEGVNLMNAVLGESQAARFNADRSDGFDPPGATITIGMAEGGTAANILARRFSFVWDLRWPAGFDADGVEARIRAQCEHWDADIRARGGGGVTFTRRSGTVPLAARPGNDAELLARALTGDNDTHTASFAAEAGQFQEAGLACVVCGPGDIAQAHQPDEWIAESELVAGAHFMKRLIEKLNC